MKATRKARSAASPWWNGAAPHLPCADGDLPHAVLFPGDPGRVDMFSSVLENFEIVGQNREFRVGRGLFRGTALGVCSTGIGGPSTEIALVEAAELGCKVALRVGGCGALRSELPLGSLLIVESAIRGGGAASSYNKSTDPIDADARLVRAITQAASDQQIANSRVTVASTDSYYAGQGRSFPNAPANVAQTLERYTQLGVAALDMEAESVLVIGRALGMISGVLLAVHGNRITDAWLEDYAEAQLQMIRVACVALTQLIRETPSLQENL